MAIQVIYIALMEYVIPMVVIVMEIRELIHVNLLVMQMQEVIAFLEAQQQQLVQLGPTAQGAEP